MTINTCYEEEENDLASVFDTGFRNGDVLMVPQEGLDLDNENIIFGVFKDTGILNINTMEILPFVEDIYDTGILFIGRLDEWSKNQRVNWFNEEIFKLIEKKLGGKVSPVIEKVYLEDDLKDNDLLITPKEGYWEVSSKSEIEGFTDLETPYLRFRPIKEKFAN